MALTVVPLGGMGTVTQNLFLYELGNEILMVDCGIGFPDHKMPGVDILIPDVSYLVQQLEDGKELVGIVFSHGHDDHIAALPYLTEFIPNVPIYGSPLTAAFATQRLRDGGSDRVVTPMPDKKRFRIGTEFEVELIHVTHSVPDTKHVVIRTSEGILYHGSDFKFDPKPVDGRVSDLARMKEIGEEGVLCVLSDCLRVEQEDQIPSESLVGPVIQRLMSQTSGKCVVTLMSSHIHRIQQVVDASVHLGRKVTFVGRSVEQNVTEALSLGQLTVPEGVMLDKKNWDSVKESKLTMIIAGSQGQEGSSLTRAVYGEHREVQIKPQDTVIFSAGPIPGNELNFYGAIDELSRNNIQVYYPDIEPGLHQSGHASALEQRQLVQLLKPRMLWPIGGADRHRRLYQHMVATPEGYDPDRVIIPQNGDVVSFGNGRFSVPFRLTLRPQAVDGLGVGDVGPRVLGDRRQLSEAGMVVVIIPKDSRGGKNEYDFRRMQVISHGFVFMKEAGEVVDFIKGITRDIIMDSEKLKEQDLARTIERKLQRKLYKTIQREPLVTVVFI